MSILAIETSTTICAVAIVSNGRVIAEQTLSEPQAHSEQLLGLVDKVLSVKAIERNSLDAVAVSIGPGSFTGLRIGLSVAKGLCFAWDKPIIAVPTLTALAWNCKCYSIGEDGDFILPMIDARRNEAYAALFQLKSGEIIEVQPAQVVTIDTCVNWASQHKRIIVLGDAITKFLHTLEQQNQPKSMLIVPQEEYRISCAASVGLLGEQLLAKGVTANVASLEPHYIKEFVTVAQPQIMVNQHGMV